MGVNTLSIKTRKNVWISFYLLKMRPIQGLILQFTVKEITNQKEIQKKLKRFLSESSYLNAALNFAGVN